MKTIQFTVPLSEKKAIVFEHYADKYFYPHLHRHEEYQLMWVIKGEGTLIANHNMLPFKSNDVFMIGPNQPHVFKSEEHYFKNKSGQHNIRGLALFFDPKGTLSPIFKMPTLEKENLFLNKSRGGFKVPEPMNHTLVAKLIEVEKTKGAQRLSYFFSLLHFLYQNKGEFQPLSGDFTEEIDSEDKGRRIQLLYDYILHNYYRPLSLEEVADHANLTVPAFCRYFKKHTGKTFVTFLNELRIHEACKKLTSKEGKAHQIVDIAYECGFNSITNFNRVFKAVMEESPSSYKKRILTL